MSLTQYYTATSLDGFIADPDNSLDWLFTRKREPDGPLNYGEFIADVGAMAMGSTTYEWILDHEFADKDPAEWRWQYDVPCWVFTHRQLPVVPDSGVEFTSADIATVHKEMVGAAGDRNVWIVGGGDLAGQFADVGLLDEVMVLIAPVALGGARRCCPAGSSCVSTSSDGTATSPPPGTPSCARRHDAGNVAEPRVCDQGKLLVAEPFPPIDPYDHGMLDVGDGNLVYWEVCGNPDGKPALVVHGGPGSGSGPGNRRYFDPERYRVVLFDQRGCGRSTPHASDPATDMTVNTTHHLIADMERLREHLGIEQWLLYGGSWGSTLIVAYAERHPQRVSQIVILGATTTRRTEIDWLYRGVARFFPEEWEQFRAGVPATERDADLVAAYAQLMEDPDPDVRARAAADWVAWEDAVISLEPKGKPKAYSSHPPDALLAFVRICAHYFAHEAWLEDEELLRHADRLAGIPAVLIHGRLDMGSPLGTAWELARAWPDARLVVVDDSGHTGSEAMKEEILRTTARLARC